MDSKRKYFSDKSIFEINFRTYIFKLSVIKIHTYFQINCTFKMHFDRLKELMRKENDFYQQVN